METTLQAPPLLCEYHIVNPAAGKGRAAQALQKDGEINVYHTKCVGDAERFVYETLQKNPYSRFYAYGGDGTFHEVISGIVRAGATQTAVFTPVAAGSGNDFVRSAKRLPADCFIDLLCVDGTYSLNMVNIGFDCHVADVAGRYKSRPLCSGSASYIAGIVSTLCKKMGQHMKITYVTEDGVSHTADGEFLLVLCANGSYCGGGFNSVPYADLQDGLLDLLLVNKISRTKFLSLVPYYKKGTHFAPDGTVKEQFREVLTHVRCREVSITANDICCIDGEIARAETVHISVLPRALHIMLPDAPAQSE